MRTIIKISKSVLVAIKEHKSINEDLVIKIKNIINNFVFYKFNNRFNIDQNTIYLLNKINYIDIKNLHKNK
jgi:hypothetical protein